MADRQRSGLGWAVEALLLLVAGCLALLAVVAFDATEPPLIGDPRPDGWQWAALLGWAASASAIVCVLVALLRRPIRRARAGVRREQHLADAYYSDAP
jgi:hypothetical protein